MIEIQNKFYPKLDSLRAIAVLLVIVSHWFSDEHFLNRYTSNGTIGVTLFFVLSGFLITGILLNYKTNLSTDIKGIGKALKVFYWRRSLRIFPIYYLLLFCLLIIHLAPFKGAFWWHFFYASNVYFWLQGSFQGSFSHFWSLAVEEQFYLIWPILILVISVRKLMGLFLIGILAAVLYRLLFISESNEMARFLLPGSIDSFAIGAIFAMIKKGMLKISYKLNEVKAQWLLGFVFFILSQTCMNLPLPKNWNLSFYLSLLSLSFGWMILACCNVNESNSKSFFLENRILMYLGKISYGLYLYHNFIPYFYDFKVPGLPAFASLYIAQFMRFGMLISIASISWFFIEKPLLRFKNKISFS